MMQMVLEVVDQADHSGDREIGLQSQKSEQALAKRHSNEHGVADKEQDPSELDMLPIE
ncbi:TPA: hypothetical protein L5Q86_003097 [Pseudomonas aeruginosa]|nr:hypothetical protein [Pseudomonas aeruginosa]